MIVLWASQGSKVIAQGQLTPQTDIDGIWWCH